MKKNTFYMVFLEGESSSTYKHDSIDSANIEAERLARVHNKKAYVLCSIKAIERNEFKVEDLRPEDDLPF